MDSHFSIVEPSEQLLFDYQCSSYFNAILIINIVTDPNNFELIIIAIDVVVKQLYAGFISFINRRFEIYYYCSSQTKRQMRLNLPFLI